MKKNIGLALFLFCFSFSIFASPTSQEQHSFQISKNLSIFNTVLRELDLNYVDTLDYNTMIKSTIDDMLSKLDPYTIYMPESETDDLTFMTTGEYAGIGALIMKQGDKVYISQPYKGMPAQMNDVRAGDVILAIDGKNIKGLSVSDVSTLLKGTPGTKIKLKLQRLGEKRPIIREFNREKIQINPVAYYAVVGNKIGYVMLTEFTDKSAMEMKSAINNLVRNDSIKSVIIDLRNNGGGLVDEAVKILGYFLPKGTAVVTTKGKYKADEHVYKTPTEPLFPNMKIAVLVNSSTASASEIVTGSIQDLDRGIVIGGRTFGKGLVQDIRNVGYGGHLKVTTAKYYIPSGRCIQAIDYSHRNPDGSVGRVPDSLTSVFYTKNGRPVRDGGGIVPDIKTQENKKINVAYYILAQNLYFDFVNQFVLTHPTVAKPSEFVLSDTVFNDFINYLMKKKFTYTTQSERYFDQLVAVAKAEGYDAKAKAQFAALKKKLTPDIRESLLENKKDISEMLSDEIMRRYYFQKGQIKFSLRSDKDLKTAIEKLSNVKQYDEILKKK